MVGTGITHELVYYNRNYWNKLLYEVCQHQI